MDIFEFLLMVIHTARSTNLITILYDVKKCFFLSLAKKKKCFLRKLSVSHGELCTK